MTAAYSVNPAAGAGTMPQHLRRPPAPCAGASNDAPGPKPTSAVCCAAAVQLRQTGLSLRLRRPVICKDKKLAFTAV
ncbi:hypothetical protein BD293_4554 [Roseinatronobacter monicus]|uniref:Uncharacterized protein n=1 Tax=Roseinatronobacter monicus TaxID=393481 RepID=A0A543K393_9RHOB|nr:hypothetical protein BD293_4554 [Roseinatronobacter monicus]